ncbi:hypothetical protein ACFVSW_11550 [Neobacillus sp. NPDC058068]|uniref:hypothetical protein n=1 Tax=Neobacillus sp. NPDC058068 TaxID=3346325 RepID=UPI0036D87DA6
MKILKNERGYALVTVLLLITIFTVVFLAFMGQSFGSVKQNQVVEKKSKSVAAAEMGVSLYQVAVQNFFETKLEDFKKIVPPTQSDFKVRAATQLATDIQTAFRAKYPINNKYYPISGDSNIAITNKKFTATSNSNKILISFSVMGTEKMKDTILDGEMTIDLSPSIYKAIEKPNPPDCTSYSSSCKEILVGSGSINTGNNMVDQKIFSTGNLTLNGPVNNMDGMKIHGETIYIDGNAQHVKNSTIESEGDMTVNGHLTPPSGKDPINLDLFVGGNLTVLGKFELTSNDSRKVYVKNGVKVADKMEIGSNYTVCIKGNLEVPKGVDIFGKLYLMGNIIGSYNGPYTKITEGELPADIQTKCGPTFTNPTIETLINNIVYK